MAVRRERERQDSTDAKLVVKVRSDYLRASGGKQIATCNGGSE